MEDSQITPKVTESINLGQLVRTLKENHTVQASKISGCGCTAVLRIDGHNVRIEFDKNGNSN